jgi:hypothetical protein
VDRLGRCVWHWHWHRDRPTAEEGVNRVTSS